MKKRWNEIGKMAVCTAAVMVIMGTGFGMTAKAEMVTDGEAELQEVQEVQEVQELVPGLEDTDVLEADAPVVLEEAPEAGETEEALLDVTQIVTIEENMIPGAAMPEFEMEGDAQEEAEEPEEGKEPEELPEEKSETCVSGTLTYEDSEVAVTVVVSEEAQLPADTEVKVTKLEEGSAEYEAAKEAARASLGAGESAAYTFYDVTLESEGQVLDVAEGTVSVRMEFRTEAQKKDVVSIEETESGKVARNVTDTEAAEGKAGSVAISY